MNAQDMHRRVIEAFNEGGPHEAGAILDLLASLLANVLSGLERDRAQQAWQRFVEVIPSMTQRLRDQRQDPTGP